MKTHEFARQTSRSFCAELRRRRVGKSALIIKSIMLRRAIYCVGTQSSQAFQLKEFAACAARALHDSLLEMTEFCYPSPVFFLHSLHDTRAILPKKTPFPVMKKVLESYSRRFSAFRKCYASWCFRVL